MAEAALDFLGDLRRTDSCGELRADDVGKAVVSWAGYTGGAIWAA